VLREKTLSAAVLELAGSMAAVGLQGSGALVLGYLFMQRSLLDSFRWGLPQHGHCSRTCTPIAQILTPPCLPHIRSVIHPSCMYPTLACLRDYLYSMGSETNPQH
jgi:hypothetical protein